MFQGGVGRRGVESVRPPSLVQKTELEERSIVQQEPIATSRVAGAGFRDLENDQARLAWRAFNNRKEVEQGGVLKFVHGDEYHAFNPDVVVALQKAVDSRDYGDYQAFAQLVNQRPAANLRDLLKFRLAPEALPLEAVESEEDIVKA